MFQHARVLHTHTHHSDWKMRGESEELDWDGARVMGGGAVEGGYGDGGVRCSECL